jgi:hypothetical protein
MTGGYTESPQLVDSSGDPAAVAFTAVADVLIRTVVFPVEVVGLLVKVVVAPTVTAPVISLQYAPLLAAGYTYVTKATVTIPVGSAIGSFWYNDQFQYFLANIGDSIKARVTTAATAGTGNVWVVWKRIPQKKPAQAAATYSEVAA